MADVHAGSLFGRNYKKLAMNPQQTHELGGIDNSPDRLCPLTGGMAMDQ